MSIEIKMPMLSPTMTKGIIANWLVEVGENVTASDIIVEVETDKVTIEVEANDDGVIGEIFAQIGDEVPVHNVIATLEAPGTVVEKAEKSVSESDAMVETNIATPAVIEATSSHVDYSSVDPFLGGSLPSNSFTSENGALNMSPLARRMAEQQHIDANKIIGSGAKGKIVKRDIELSMGVDLSKPAEIAASQTLIEKIEINYDTLPPFTRKKNSGMRTVVAERLTESSRDIPHFHMTVDCQIDTLLAMRKQLNDRKSAFYKISVNDFVIKAVAAAMKLVPEANCMWDGDSVIYFDQVDVSVAVAVDDGLITPVVKKACSNGLATISNKAKELVIGAREGKLKPADYQGGTFTISNLGMFGIDNFTSIINLPQNGILSVGAGQQKPIVVDGELSIATVMSVTLAMDHRCVDGAIGARFLKAFKETIEDPISIIL
jgi:pyruvate dehydrogenase E2 component (dihydrolipoamide acetyltransferase)